MHSSRARAFEPQTLAARFSRERSGLAAVEFALILPIMVLLFFGMLEASDLFTVNRRLANAANSLVDLAAHEPTLTHAQLDDMIVGVTRILEPTDTSTVVMRVISIRKGSDINAQPTVHWSRDEDGAEPYPQDSTYTGLDDNLSLNADSALLVVEVEYTYDSSLPGKVFTIPFDFEHVSKRLPRKSGEVQLCATTDPATCTT
jgi:Flp pilus assembly protein TadG